MICIMLYKYVKHIVPLNPNQPGLLWRLSCPGGGGGGCSSPPLQISAVDRAIAAKICIKVECDVNFVVFHYKSLIKASRLQIFGTYILFNLLSNCVLKNFSIKINFLCIYCFINFLCIHVSLFFQPFFFFFFFAEISCSDFLKHYLAKIN